MKISVVWVVLIFGCAACSIRVGGGAKVSADGHVAILSGSESILIEAPQPPAPVPPPPPPKPRKVLKAQLAGEKIELTGAVLFEDKGAIIKPECLAILNDVGILLMENTEIKKVRIEGHTDDGGDDARNKKLSQERADAVKAFLLTAGIDDSRLESVGYGGERPLASNDTPAGREKNRRVEFSILVRDSSSVSDKPEGQYPAPGTPKDETATYKKQAFQKSQ